MLFGKGSSDEASALSRQADSLWPMKRWRHLWVYAFKDTDLALEDEKSLNSQLDKGTVKREELRERLKKAEMVLILSNHDTEPENIYDLHTSRGGSQKAF